jgi:hypothetical protein
MASAQCMARVNLVHMYPAEYRRYYLEEKRARESNPDRILKSHIRAQAQSRAKTRLVQAHVIEYRLLYEEAVEEGHHRGHGTVSHREIVERMRESH